ncbi:uncharacterized protein LOC112592372 [Melanaphis sacchari]|uniref:uncharacterized protein LOC112592372 n=1 Tax=Melanaphis sacchari TaxID=742174 RepID=UPI000DC131EE|nr:uncharacterized protein LOC112592372 [Melanaphis sacchari]
MNSDTTIRRILFDGTCWTRKGIKYEKIERDDTLWQTKMFPKLNDFFFNCLLPELVDPRHPRSMPIRNPNNILEAKRRKNEQKMNKQIITNEIRRCGKYSLICDEARSFKEEQLSLCVRYCNGFEVCERFIKFIDCSQSRDAESLKNIIINELKQLEIADIPIVAQTYDGASVMSGAVGGLQAKIREKYPTAVYFHCAAHKLALVVTDTYITLGQATSAINGVIQTLQEKRSDKNFKLLWNDITNFSRKFGICLNYEEFSKKKETC